MNETEDKEYGDSEDESADLFARLQCWVKEDLNALSEWRKEAELDFAIYAGHGQWDDVDRNYMRENKRPCITLNRIAPAVQAVNGMEVSNRQEVKFKPRTTSQATQPGQEIDPQTQQPLPMPVMGGDDTGVNELLTAAAKYFREQCDAEDEDSDAFQDSVICGMGWTETRVDYMESSEGKIVVDRIDPLEMGWDCKASKRNLVDARRIWRVREIDKMKARELFPDIEMSELDASWASAQSIGGEPHDREAAREYRGGFSQSDTTSKKTVTICEIEWLDYETAWKVGDPETGEVIEVDQEQLALIQERAQIVDMNVNAVKVQKRVIRYAFLGKSLIESGVSQSETEFKYKSITGYRDRNKRQFVGIVRGMRDAQRWTNALFSSVLYQIQTNGKGIMAERDAFENAQNAEADFARSDKIVWMKTGALSGGAPKVQPKPQGILPQGTIEMMQMSTQAMRDVSGINVESLGLADRQQAAALEAQRKQSATTLLATLFDGLRRYRKEQGRLMLILIQKYLSDGRLVRIAGPDYEAYVPLVKDESVAEYDVIVDDAPASTNQKELTWGILQELLPILMKQPTPPEAFAAFLRASPLPRSTVDEYMQAMQSAEQAASEQPDPAQMQMQMQADMQAQEMQIKHRELDIKNQELEIKDKEIDARRIEASSSAIVEISKVAQQALAQGQTSFAASMIALSQQFMGQTQEPEEPQEPQEQQGREMMQPPMQPQMPQGEPQPMMQQSIG